MVKECLSEARVTTLVRLLYVELALALIVALFALLKVIGDFEKYAVTLIVIAVLLSGLGAATLEAVRKRRDSAKRLCIATGVLLIIASLPLGLIGLLTVVL